MIICPWCGTNYLSFQPNCKNCGGPLQALGENTAVSPTSIEEIIAPPPVPRPISNKYIWRLVFTEGRGIVALVLGLLGIIFSLLGAGLTFFVVTAFVGIPFLLIGLIFLVVAAGIGMGTYHHARQVVNVLRIGEVTQGQILNVRENYSVRVNGQRPWVIRYQFQVNGQDFEGNVSTLNQIGANLQPGNTVYILYMPNDPHLNSIYPHP